jgi:hypothetical protein
MCCMARRPRRCVPWRPAASRLLQKLIVTPKFTWIFIAWFWLGHFGPLRSSGFSGIDRRKARHRLRRECGSSWLCVYSPSSSSFCCADPTLKRELLVFVGGSSTDRSALLGPFTFHTKSLRRRSLGILAAKVVSGQLGLETKVYTLPRLLRGAIVFDAGCT